MLKTLLSQQKYDNKEKRLSFERNRDFFTRLLLDYDGGWMEDGWRMVII